MKKILLSLTVSCLTFLYSFGQVALNENFSSGSLPAGWTSASVSSGDSWAFGGTVDFGSTLTRLDAFGVSGQYARLDFSSDPDTTSLITPQVSIAGYTQPRLTFYYNSQTTSSSFTPYNRFIVDYWNGASWVNILVVDTLTTAGWAFYEFDISTYKFGTDIVQFRFSGHEGGANVGGTGTSTYDQDMMFDEVVIEQTPSCLVPTALNATALSNGIQLSWTENNSATNWEIEYGPKGFSQGTGTAVVTSSNPYTATTIASGSEYDWYVKSICAAADSSLWAQGSSVVYAGAPIGGTYTLNSASPTSATNFNSFANLAVKLNFAGIVAPVVVNVSPGTYSEQFTISTINGSNATNTVLINGSSSSNTTLTHDKSVDNATISLDGATYVTIKNMTVAATGGSDSWGIHITNGAHHITIDSNNVNTPLGTTSDVTGIMVSGSTTSDNSTGDVDDLVISNNTVRGGERGISVYGSFTSSARSQNLTVHNNDVQDADDNGLYITGYNNVTITDNFVDGLTSNFSDGMYSSDLENFTVTGNSFKGGDNGWEGQDNNFDNTVTSPSIVANNMFIGNDDGLYLDDIDMVNIYHNSTSGADYGLYLNDQTNLDIRNNIFTSNDGDIAFYYADAATIGFSVLDFNLYYTTGATIARSTSGNYADLTAFQAAFSGTNASSVVGDPTFLDPTSDLHAAGIAANDVGDNSVGITVDIDGDTRPLAPSTVVDLGADEFSPPSCAFPGGLALVGATDAAATVSWVEGGSTTQWSVEYGLSGFSTGSGTSIVVTTDTFTTITGLSAQTSYDFYVRSICGSNDTSAYSASGSFTTLCAAFPAPFVEDFTTFVPNCWDEANNGDVASGPTGLGSGEWAQSGTAVRINLWNTGTSDWILTPTVDFGTGGYELAVDVLGYDYGSSPGTFAGMGSDDVVQIVTSSDNGLTWNVAYTWDAANQPASTSATQTIDLTALTGNHLIAIYATEGTTDDGEDFYFQIERFELKTPPVKAPISLPITWDDGATVDLTTVDFGGNTSMVVTDPTNASNMVLQGIKTVGAQTWGGTSFGDSLANAIPFDASNTILSAVVWSADSGVVVKLKAEDHTNPALSVETDVTTTKSGWDTLRFDMSLHSVGAPLNFTTTYDKLSIFYNFGVTQAVADTFYVDLVEFTGGTAPPPAKDPIGLPITWEDTATVDYTVIDFGGNASMMTTDPMNTNNLVLQSIKTVGAQTWAGTTFGNSLDTSIAFSTGNTTIRAVVYSPLVGVEVRVKVEDQTNGGISVESVDTTTVVGWDTLNFDMSVQASGTAAINFANTYDKMSIFYNFGVSPTVADTFYVDYVAFENPPVIKDPIGLPITWEDTATVDYTVIDFGGNASMMTTDPMNTNNLVLQSIKTVGAQTWAGTTFGNSLDTSIAFSTGNTTIRAVVYSPLVGVEVRVKVEDQTNGGISVESVDTTTVVGWDTLNFDMSVQASGTAAINFANTYDKMSIFYNFGVSPTVADTFYVDYVAFENPPVISMSDIPYLQDFEGFANGAPTAEGWTNVRTGNPQWLADNGGTPSSATGPTVDHTVGTTAGRYIFLETSSSTAGVGDTLVSSIINTGVNDTILELSYWYHMHGATMGTLEAWVIDVATGTPALLNTITGQQQAGQTDAWLQSKVAIAGFENSQIMLAFVGVAGSSYTSDMSIDDVAIGYPPADNIGITSIVGPNSGCGLSSTDSVEVVITNFGSATQTNFNVGYSVNGTAITPEVVSGPLAGGMSMNYTFTTPINLGVAGSYSIDAYSLLTGDSDNSNDSSAATVTSYGSVSTFPYAQSFETGSDWSVEGNSTFALGAPAGTLIDTASDGTQAWVTNLSGDYNAGESGYIISPCFDFTNVVNPYIALDLNYEIEGGWDGAVMQTTTDGGTTWSTVGAFNDPVNWYNDNGVNALATISNQLGWSTSTSGNWITAEHYLDGLGGQSTVQIRILLASDGGVQEEGIGVDNINIWDRPIPDPYYPIGTINTEDATTGVADSLNVFAWTSGTVVGVDLDGNAGLSFTIIDMSSGSQEGINVYRNIDVSNYVVTEGDSIMIHGEVIQYRGLTELQVDSISVISTGNAIPSAIVTNTLGESTESKWINMTDKFVLLDPSGSNSYNMDATNGTDTITIRIDADTDINDSLNVSTNALVIGDTICGMFGVGGQFTFNTPLLDGYQIFPMRYSDITICRNTIGIKGNSKVNTFSIYPNPSNGMVTIESSGYNNNRVEIEVLDLNGRTVASSLVLNGTAPSRELIDLSDVAKGIYFVSIIDGESRLVEKLVIK